MSFLAHMKQRRTIYAIGQNVPITADQIEEVIKDAVRNSPSAFNSQTSRVVTLYGDSHAKFWNIVRETLRKLVPEEAFENTNAKINGFAAGYGTVLFYEDQDVVKSLQEQFPLYAEHFPAWSEHSTGIAQFAVWSSLAEQHIGASLQHYNPVIDDEVAATFDIPKNWKLRAELVFGSIEARREKKHFLMIVFVSKDLTDECLI